MGAGACLGATEQSRERRGVRAAAGVRCWNPHPRHQRISLQWLERPERLGQDSEVSVVPTPVHAHPGG